MSPVLGSLLSMDTASLSSSAPPPAQALSLSLALSQINKILKKRKKEFHP